MFLLTMSRHDYSLHNILILLVLIIVDLIDFLHNIRILVETLPLCNLIINL